MEVTKRTRYFLIALCLTSCLMLFKKSNIFDSIANPNTLRNLIDQTKKNYLCDKAGSRLTDKYKTDYSEDDIEKESLSSAQRSIIDFARDSSYSNIKPYLKRLAIYIVFIVIAILFIFFWISYCSCCCCSCCLFGDSKPNRFCSCLWLFIAIVCNFLVLIFSIIVLAIISPFFKRMYGIGCSTATFLDHVSNGLAPHYSSRAHEWEGLEELINKVESIQTQANAISKNSTFNQINGDEENYENTCNNEYNELKNGANTIQSLLNSSFDGLTKIDAIEDLRDVNYDIIDAEDKVVDKLYDALHDYANKYAMRLSKAIFSLTLIFSFLGLAILIIFLFFKNACLKIIYIVIWNISMLLVILAIIESASYGILGYILKDGVQVASYILSEENLNSNDPLIFENNNYYHDGYGYNNNEENNYITDLIEICANGNGNFTNVIKGGKELYSHLDEWKEKKTLFTQRKNSINCNNGDKLKEYYDKLIELVDQSLNMTYNITNVTCRFARNDKNILLNEAESGGNKGIALAALDFLIGIFLGISVFAGILFIHKFDSTWKENNKHINNAMNESSSNIGQENNNNTTNPNNNTMPYPNNTMPYPNNNMMPYPNNNVMPYPNNNMMPYPNTNYEINQK